MPKNNNNKTQEEVFCSGTVQFYAQPIGIVVAETRELAEKAADLVRVTFTKPKAKSYLNILDVLADNVKERIITRNSKPPTRKGTDKI